MSPLIEFIRLIDESTKEVRIVHNDSGTYAIDKDRRIIHALVGGKLKKNVIDRDEEHWILDADNQPYEIIHQITQF